MFMRVRNFFAQAGFNERIGPSAVCLANRKTLNRRVRKEELREVAEIMKFPGVYSAHKTSVSASTKASWLDIATLAVEVGSETPKAILPFC
jgi:hypothetical protein